MVEAKTSLQEERNWRKRYKVILSITFWSILVLFLLAPIGLTKVTDFSQEGILLMLGLVGLSITLSMLSFSIAQSENEDEKSEYKLSGLLFAISGILWFMVTLSVYALAGEKLFPIIGTVYTLLFTLFMVISVIFFMLGVATLLTLLVSSLCNSPSTRDLLAFLRRRPKDYRDVK